MKRGLLKPLMILGILILGSHLVNAADLMDSYKKQYEGLSSEITREEYDLAKRERDYNEFKDGYAKICGEGSGWDEDPMGDVCNQFSREMENLGDLAAESKIRLNDLESQKEHLKMEMLGNSRTLPDWWKK